MGHLDIGEPVILQVVTGLLKKNGGPIKSSLTHHETYLKQWNAKFLTIGPNDEELIGKVSSEALLMCSSILQNEYGLSSKLIKLFRIFHPTRIVIHHGFFLASLLYSMLFVRKDSKIFIIAHGSFQRFSRGKRKLLKSIFVFFFSLLSKRKISITFVAMTNAEISDIHFYFPKSNVVVTGLGFDLDMVKKMSKNIDAPRILCLSRIAQKKRIDLCIKSLQILRNYHPNIELVVAGSGSKQLTGDLIKLVADLDLTKHVSFVGHVDEPESFERLFADADLLLLPSEDENFALSVAEAIIRGLPVVVSKNVGLSQVVKERNFGQVIDNLNEVEISHAVLEVFENWDYYNAKCLQDRTFFSHDRVKKVWSSMLS